MAFGAKSPFLAKLTFLMMFSDMDGRVQAPLNQSFPKKTALLTALFFPR